jgi:uncharacterized RDD family membrane protein YckC
MPGTLDQGFIHIQSTELLFLENELADIGSRALAFSIDLAIRAAGAVLPLILLAKTTAWIPQILRMIIISLFGLTVVAYPFVFEAIMAGKTPGKRLVGIRVLKSDGSRISLLDALIRNVLRLIDAFPAGYMLGMTLIFFEKYNRRLGDLVADTIVIYDRSARHNFRQFIDSRLIEAQPRKSIVITGIDRLTPDEQSLIKELFGRLVTMEDEEKQRILEKFREKIFARLTIAGTDDVEVILYELYKRI